MKKMTKLSGHVLAVCVATGTLQLQLATANEPVATLGSSIESNQNSTLTNNKGIKRFIVKFKDGAMTGPAVLSSNGVTTTTFSTQAAESMLSQMNAQAVNHLDFMNASVVNMDVLNLKILMNHPSVEYVEEDHRRYLFDMPVTMAQQVPYGISMVQADQVSDANSANIKVCVIDTGYQFGHEDLPTGGVTGFSFNGHGSWSNDGNGHGTHVAGTILALDNNVGVVGVMGSGFVGLHNVKIFNDSGNWTFASNLIQGIQSCKNAGATVVNMSLGGGSSNNTERNAMQGFYDDGMLLIAAAGNSGNTSFSYPASYDAVVSVAAVDSNKNRASFSQRNSQVEISGPGVNVLSTSRNGGYVSFNGTSMATPHVAGVAALVWSNHPQCSAPEIRNALNLTAERRGTSGRNNDFGWGIVKAKDAHDWLTQNGCSGDGGTTPPGENFVFPNLSANQGAWLRGSYTIPAGVSKLTFRISGGSGDADLYIRNGTAPTTNAWDCRPYQWGNEEECVFTNPQAGTWHVGLQAYSAFSGVTFSYSYEY